MVDSAIVNGAIVYGAIVYSFIINATMVDGSILNVAIVVWTFVGVAIIKGTELTFPVRSIRLGKMHCVNKSSTKNQDTTKQIKLGIGNI